MIELLAEEDIELSLDYLRTLAPEAQLTHVVEQGRRSGLFPPDMDRSTAERLLKVFKTHSRAAQHYRPQPYDGTITLFAASEPHTKAEHNAPFRSADQGWAEVALGGVNIQPVPGNHQTLVKAPHVTALAERLQNCLEHCPSALSDKDVRSTVYSAENDR